MAQCVHRDQQVQRLHARTSPRKGEAEVAGLLPESRWLLQQMTARQERQHASSLSGRTKASAELRQYRPTESNLVGLECAVHGARDRFRPAKELDPCRRVDEDQRRVCSRSRSIRSRPLSALSAERRSLRSRASRPAMIVSVIPRPVMVRARRNVSDGRVTVIFVFAFVTTASLSNGQSWSTRWSWSCLGGLERSSRRPAQTLPRVSAAGRSPRGYR